MATKRKSKHITNKTDVDYILGLTSQQAARRSVIIDMFGEFNGKRRFEPYDTIDIPPGAYGQTKKNKNKFTTTVGLWVFNKGSIEPIADEVGYINHTIDSDFYDDLNQELSYARLEDRISLKQFKEYLMKSQVYMSCVTALSPSHDVDLLLFSDKVESKKNEIINKHRGAIDNDNVDEMSAIEKELIDYAKEELKDTESADMFKSGARSSWGNNFKNMYLTKGPVKLTDGSYKYIKSSHMSGLDPEDFDTISDAAIYGPFSRSNKTREGGYMEKQFIAATQHLKVLPEGSDCKTKRCKTIKFDKKNIKDWMYCYVVNDNGSYTEITSKNRNSFIGKTVKIRSADLCESKEGICEKCMGSLYRRIGIENVGLGTAVIASSLKNTAMKAFHNSTLKITRLDPKNDIFGI